MKTLVAVAAVLTTSLAAFAGPHEIALRPVEHRLQIVAAGGQAPYALTGHRATKAQQPTRQQAQLQDVIRGGRGNHEFR